MKKNILYFLIFLICILLLPNSNVYAKTEKKGIRQFSICIKKGKKYAGYYLVYDSNKLDLQGIWKDGDLTLEHIQQGHIPYPDGIKEADKKNYQFTATKISNINCKANGGVYYCPQDKKMAGTKINETYVNANETESTTYNNISFKSDITDPNNPKYNITINDMYEGKLLIRAVTTYDKTKKEFTNTTDEEMTAMSYSDSAFLQRKKKSGKDEWYYELTGISAETPVRLEFFQKVEDNQPCSGVYITYITIVTPSGYDIMVDNPAPNYQVCKDVKNFTGASDLREKDKQLLNTTKLLLFPQCYNDSKIKLGELKGLKETLEESYTSLESMFGDDETTEFPDASTDDAYVCSSQYVSKPKITYADAGNYWGMVCRENYTAKGSEKPDIVKAGDGFSYETKFSVTRACSIIQLKVPTVKPTCSTTVTPHCSWVLSNGATGTGNDAGPNDDFDDCIIECDNGAYTQACINECYKKVYGNNRNSSLFDDLLSYSKKNNKNQIAFMKSTNTKSFTSGNCGKGKECECTTEHKRKGEKLIYTDPASGVSGEACFSPWCGNHSGSCYFTVTTTPDDCSYDPNAALKTQMTASREELNGYINKYEEEINVGTYEYQIADSYLVKQNGSDYSYTVDNVSDPKLNVVKNQTTIKKDTDKMSNICLGDNNVNTGGIQCSAVNAEDTYDYTVDYYKYAVSTMDITVKLPLSYVNKKNGSAAYKTSESSENFFTVDSKNNKLKKLDSFNAKDYYNKDGERKYYTSVWSKSINVEADCDKKEVRKKDDGTYNIIVTSEKVGDGEFGSSIKCSYSVWNEYYGSDSEVCGERGFIYRTIDLNNMFPNRDARYNWTGTIRNGNTTGAAVKESDSIYDDSVDPETLIDEIQSKGNSIYNVSSDSSEIDYEFVLTTQNIRNIRKYNKNVRDYNKDGENNYLDYNMNCYTNGDDQEVCTSRFLNNKNWNSGSEANDSFITYSVPGYNITNRKAIAVCNNAINGNDCDNIGK